MNTIFISLFFNGAKQDTIAVSSVPRKGEIVVSEGLRMTVYEVVYIIDGSALQEIRVECKA